MRDRLRAETNAALKAQDKPRLSALRLISAALQQSDIAAKAAIPDAEIPALLQKMIKQRRESLAIFEKAGRTEQAQQEATEIAVIEEFLPKQMSEAEAKEAIAAAVKEVGAASPKEMGKVMAALKERYAGRMDFGKASGAGEGAAEVAVRGRIRVLSRRDGPQRLAAATAHRWVGHRDARPGYVSRPVESGRRELGIRQAEGKLQRIT